MCAMPSARYLIVAIATVLTGSALSAPTENYNATPSRFRQIICDPFGVAGTASSSFPRGPNPWTVQTGIDTFQADNDKLIIDASAFHLAGPHGEAGGQLYHRVFAIDADKYDEGNAHTINDGASFHHESHWDKYAARVVFDTTSSLFGDDQITSYSFILLGVHTLASSDTINIDSSLVSTNIVPPFQDAATGNLMFVYNRPTHTFDATIVVTNIDKNQIIGASLNIGKAGQNGQFLTQIGQPTDWQPLGQNSASLMLDNLQFPQQFEPFIKKGMLYVKIHTLSHPNGAIRGQLTRTLFSASS